MPDINADDLLLELMGQFRPHLQTYKYKMQAWDQLLNEFNRITRSSIKQVRTLKTRFEKLKSAYEDGFIPNVANVALLKELVLEFNGNRKSRNRDLVSYMSPVFKKQKIDVGIALETGVREQSTEDDKDSDNDPPPLDTIGVFPATQMRIIQEQERHHRLDTSSVAKPSPSKGNTYSIPLSLQDSPESCSSRRGSEVQHEEHKLLNEYNKGVLLDLVSSVKQKNQLRPSDYISLNDIYEDLKQLRESHEDFKRQVTLKVDYLVALVNQKLGGKEETSNV